MTSSSSLSSLSSVRGSSNNNNNSSSSSRRNKLERLLAVEQAAREQEDYQALLCPPSSPPSPAPATTTTTAASFSSLNATSTSSSLADDSDATNSAAAAAAASVFRHGSLPHPVWREKVAQWYYDVVDSLGERRSLVYMAMNILDRYCAQLYHRHYHHSHDHHHHSLLLPSHDQVEKDDTTSTSTRASSSSSSSVSTSRTLSSSSSRTLSSQPVLNERAYELSSMTAMFLAIRMGGGSSSAGLALRIHDLLHMSRNGVTVREFIDTGTDMIQSLSWDHRVTTPWDVLTALLEYLPPSSRRASMIDTASYVMELAVCDSSLVSCKASDLALAALMNVLHTHHGPADVDLFVQSLPMVLQASTRTTTTDLASLRNRLQRLYKLSYDGNPLHYAPQQQQEQHQQEAPYNAGPHLVVPCEEDDEEHRPESSCLQDGLASSPIMAAQGYCYHRISSSSSSTSTLSTRSSSSSSSSTSLCTDHSLQDETAPSPPRQLKRSPTCRTLEQQTQPLPPCPEPAVPPQQQQQEPLEPRLKRAKMDLSQLC